MSDHRKLTPTDILPAAEYSKRRKQERKRVLALKRQRRVEVGPVATFYFENRETMWLQI